MRVASGEREGRKGFLKCRKFDLATVGRKIEEQQCELLRNWETKHMEEVSNLYVNGRLEREKKG
jgi:hypothetical protein